MKKLEAYNILKLNEDASEIEVKKNYRKLSLQYHPEKNNNSEESQDKYQKIQEAYELLIAELPINYKVNFGVSEAEIEEFEKEEIIKNLTSLSAEDLEIIAKIECGEWKDLRHLSTEVKDIYLKKSSSLFRLKKWFSDSIEEIKKKN